MDRDLGTRKDLISNSSYQSLEPYLPSPNTKLRLMRIRNTFDPINFSRCAQNNDFGATNQITRVLNLNSH